MEFKPADKSQGCWARVAIFGPSGSGKTMSCLRIAKGIAEVTDGRICGLCSEHGSILKYANVVPFECGILTDKSPKGYMLAIEAARKAGYQILIIDSLSHAWTSLVDMVQQQSQRRFRGNSWAAWSVGSPIQQQLIDSLLSYPGHVLWTMRVQTEWVVDGDGRPKRVGLKATQGKDIEYEADTLLELDAEHVAKVHKDRVNVTQDETIAMPDEKYGRRLVEALMTMEPMEFEAPEVRASASAPPPPPPPPNLPMY